MTYRDLFDETIREGIFAILILQALSKGDKRRTELHHEIGVHTDGVFCKTSSVKTVLQNLLSQELITSRTTSANETPERSLYHIEDSGREYLAYSKIHLKNVAEALRLFFGRGETEETDEKSPLP